MSEKKLFPGVSRQEADSKQALTKLQEKLRQEQEEQNKQENSIYKKYLDYPALSRATGTDKFLFWCKTNAIAFAALFALGNVNWLMLQSQEFEKGPIPTTNKYFKPYKIALHDAYIPTSKYYYDNIERNIKTVTEPTFKLHFLWCLNVFLSVCCILINTSITKGLNADFDAVDMMLDLEKLQKQYNLNTKQVYRLIFTAKNVIKKMSIDNPVYFNMLMQGDINITNQNAFKNMAVAIICGHLQSYPKDANRVLNAFEEASIPDEILHQIRECRHR